MSWAEKVLDNLKNIYEITIVSSGYSPNLIAKELCTFQTETGICEGYGMILAQIEFKS